HDPESERRGHPTGPEPDVRVLRQRDPERQCAECPDVDEQDALAGEPEQKRDLARTLSPERRDLGDTGDGGSAHEEERRDEVQEKQGVRHASTLWTETASYNRFMDERERHLRLLTETIAAVNSTLDLEEVLGLVAQKVADALGADACFVYLYDDRADELVLRATHGTAVEEMTRRPKMRRGEGITGAAAAERRPIMIPAQADLDPR